MLPTNPLLNVTAPAGPHLPVALLRQYAAGTLAPAAQHRVEAHALACARCADVLAGLLQTPAATTDLALAQLRQRLRQRGQQQAAPARLAQRPRQHRWLAPQLAAAATLLLGLVAGGWWAWQQRQPSAQSARASLLISQPLAKTAAVSRPELPVTAAPVVAPEISPTAPAPAPAKRPHAAPGPLAGRVAVAHPALRRRVAARPVVATTAVGPSPATGSANSPAPGPAVVMAAPPVVPAGAMSGPMTKLRAVMPALAATPSGGMAALREYLRQGAATFEPAAPAGPRTTGKVLVRLHIGADGQLERVEAIGKLRSDYDVEAVRLLREGPAWIPGMSAGRRAAQVVEVPVVFE